MDAFKYVLDRSLPYPFIEMAQATEAVDILLKEVRIDGTDPQAQG